MMALKERIFEDRLSCQHIPPHNCHGKSIGYLMKFCAEYSDKNKWKNNDCVSFSDAIWDEIIN
jgi:hypothetical protein